ncbi:MAG: DUF309 domain-containing protein [Anaerolineales bacterium]|nr:DUF309 domain-containing protein [Anaerolineales bacterium]
MAVRDPDEIFVTPEQLPSACQGALHPEAQRGIALFNAGQYWEAHEALESAWRDESGPARHLYKGILQAGVMYLQIQRGNYIGMAKMHARCQKWLRPWPATCRGVAVEQLRQQVAAVMAHAQQLGPERLAAFDQRLFKPIGFVAS